MHRITMPDGTIRQSAVLRWSLSVAYLLFATSGLLLMTSPHVADVYGTESYGYSTFMLAGGLLGFIGSVSKRWFGEFTGLPLLGTALLAFSYEVLMASWTDLPLLTIANTNFLVGIAVLMLARWRVALASYRLAKHVSELETEEL